MRPELVLAIIAISQTLGDDADQWYITSVTDGRHMRGSLHYVGAAIDIGPGPAARRTDYATIRDDTLARLTTEYQIILEHHADDTLSHLHIEYQPQRPLNSSAGDAPS